MSEYEKYQSFFYLTMFSFLEVKVSIYLNWRIFVMAFAQSDQRLCCPHKGTLHPWIYQMRQVKLLIRLRECAG